MEKIMCTLVCVEFIALIAITFYKPATPKELNDWINRM